MSCQDWRSHPAQRPSMKQHSCWLSCLTGIIEKDQIQRSEGTIKNSLLSWQRLSLEVNFQFYRSAPSSIHLTRWMTKWLCAIKIYISRIQCDVVNIKIEETQSHPSVQFGAILYAQLGHKAPFAAAALGQDMSLWTDLKNMNQLTVTSALQPGRS